MKKEKKKIQPSLSFMAAAVIIVTIVIFAVMYLTVYSLMEKVSRDRLNEATQAATEKVNILFEDNKTTLENVAKYVEQSGIYDDDSLIKAVNTFLPKNGTARISAIYPDDRIVTLYGTIQNSDLSFASMKADIEHGDSFSRRDTSRLYKDEVIIRQYQPIYKDGEMVLIIYALYDCNDMKSFTSNNIYQDSYNMQIIDTRDGKVVADAYFASVLDTDSSSIDGAKLKNGGRLRLSKVLKGGKGDYLFYNDILEQYMFMSYAPTSFKEYIVAIYVPEATVLSELSNYLAFAGAAGMVEIFMLILFGFWVKNKNRRDLEHYLEDSKKYSELMELKRGRGFDVGKEEIENVLSALAEGYDTLVHIDFDTSHLRTYKTGRAFAIPEETWNTVGDYHASMREFAKIKAIEEDREMLTDMTMFKAVWEDLSKGKPHIIVFRSGDPEKPEVIEMKFVHLSEHEDDHCAIVGLKYIREV